MAAKLVSQIDVTAHRKMEYPAEVLFVRRWSPRAMSGEEISDKELFTLFEAAKWAPSSYNNQPWRFHYAKRNTPGWEKLYGLMVEFNQQWTKNAAVLIVMVSKKTFDRNGKPARTHSFDSGTAWGYLALQASLMGLFAHGMQGFDYDKAKEVLGLTDEYQVEAMAAVGRAGDITQLPDEMKEQELPSTRKSVAQISIAVT
ncbi:MAG: nitroreductase [Planctomycetes bacterium GWC2_49_10]|nr:MAG: nitroreductase [Planctomycetes bacterium GWC2_49_10]